MLEGKMLRGPTGTPWRTIARAQRSFARAAGAGGGAGEQLVGPRRARAVDVGEADDEVVYAADLLLLGHDVPAWTISMRYFCMSHAPVGQRSAQSPQCRQTSSSFTMTRPVLRSLET